MPTIKLLGFKGGKANSLYDPLEKQTFQTAKDLDIFSSPNILRPNAFKLTNITAPTISGGSSYKFHNSFLASNGKWYVLGEAVISASLNFVLWSTSSLADSPTWAADYNVTTGVIGTSADEFKDGLYFGAGTNFDRWGNLSGTPSRTNIGTVTTLATVIKTHRGLGKIFFAHNSGRTVGWYDGTTFTASALTFEQSEAVIGMEPYGRFLIIGVKGSGSVPSRFVVWDGSATTIDDQLELGIGALQTFKLVNGSLRYITSTNSTGTNIINRLYELTPGGQPKIIDETSTSLTAGTVGAFTTASASYGDLFLYGYKGSTHGIDLGVFAYGSNDIRFPRAYANPLYLVSTGVTTGVSIESIKADSGGMMVIWSTLNGSGTYSIDAYGGNITKAVSSSGVYESTAFPIGNPGKIKKVIIEHKPLPASCGFTVSVKHYGHYRKGTSVPSEDSFTDLLTSEGSGSSTGITQSTTNTTYTIIEDPNIFKEARFAQIRIEFDEISGVSAADIVFPILIETE